MRILVTGAGGQLGNDIIRVFGPDHDVRGFTRTELDISDWKAVESTLRDFRPHMVFNCAAYTNVDGAELDHQTAELINGIAPGYLAELCEGIYAVFVHFSSDYVFNGEGPIPFKETDEPDPINAYGRSKLMGEHEIFESTDCHYIIRTSWLYGAIGENFIKTVLKLARSNKELRIVDDQLGAPTYTLDVARMIAELSKGKPFGIYNITNTGKCTWFELARAVLEIKGISDVKVIPITSLELARAAKRPAFSVLSTEKLSSSGVGIMRPWKAALKDFLENDLDDQETLTPAP